MPNYPKVQKLLVPLSFESGLQAQIDVKFGSRVQILRVKSTVTKALAGTDAGTVTFKNEGNTTLLTVTHAASAALATSQSVEFPAGTFVKRNQHLRFVPAKTTAGGEVSVEIEFQHVGS